LKSVEINLEVTSATLQTYQGLSAAGREWLFLLVTCAEASSLCSEAGQAMVIKHWSVSIDPASDSSPQTAQESIGSISYRSDFGGACNVEFKLSKLMFERLVQVLISGRKVTQVRLGVEGLLESGSDLIWRQAGITVLPIKLACVSSGLYEFSQPV
jgi:hypothetical protein